VLIVKLLALAVPTSDSQHTIPTHYKDIAHEIFSPVICYESIRLMFALVLSTWVGIESSDGVPRVFQGVDRKGLASTCKKLHPSHLLLL